MTAELTDAEARQQAERTDAFIAGFRERVRATVVDPTSACADQQRCGLARIAATIDQVDYIVFANLANINTAMRGELLGLIEVKLLAVGAGPTLDFESAAEFLAGFQPMIDLALRRRLN